MNRRSFLAAVLPAMRAVGANERIRVGVIGSGTRGSWLGPVFREEGAEVATVCDIYEPHLEAGLKGAPGAKPCRDYRQLLADGSIDAVVVATPDHWHPRMLIEAVEAGKDVYLEKPIARTVEEAERMVEAVRRARRIVQVGTQRRSNPMFLEAREVIRSGAAGNIRFVNSWWYNTKPAITRAQLKGKLDWRQWLGPAPERPVDPARFWDWLYFRDYSAGLLFGQGAHIIDGIQMLMGSSFPASVTCHAAAPNTIGAENPDTITLSVEFPEKYLAVFNVSYATMRYNQYLDQMKQFNGNKARFDVGREAWALYPQTGAREMKASREKSNPGSFNAFEVLHVRNFLDCVRSRKEPNAPIELGLYTTAVLAMGEQSWRTGRRMEWDSVSKRPRPVG